MNKELITLDKNNTITVTALRENSARCGWSICVFTAVGSIRTMHIHDGEAFGRFIDAATVLGGIEGTNKELGTIQKERTALVDSIHKVTNNELFAIKGIHEWHSREH